MGVTFEAWRSSSSYRSFDYYFTFYHYVKKKYLWIFNTCLNFFLFLLSQTAQFQFTKTILLIKNLFLLLYISSNFQIHISLFVYYIVQLSFKSIKLFNILLDLFFLNFNLKPDWIVSYNFRFQDNPQDDSHPNTQTRFNLVNISIKHNNPLPPPQNKKQKTKYTNNLLFIALQKFFS